MQLKEKKGGTAGLTTIFAFSAFFVVFSSIFQRFCAVLATIFAFSAFFVVFFPIFLLFPAVLATIFAFSGLFVVFSLYQRYHSDFRTSITLL